MCTDIRNKFLIAVKDNLLLYKLVKVPIRSSFEFLVFWSNSTVFDQFESEQVYSTMVPSFILFGFIKKRTELLDT